MARHHAVPPGLPAPLRPAWEGLRPRRGRPTAWVQRLALHTARALAEAWVEHERAQERGRQAPAWGRTGVFRRVQRLLATARWAELRERAGDPTLRPRVTLVRQWARRVQAEAAALLEPLEPRRRRSSPPAPGRVGRAVGPAAPPPRRSARFGRPTAGAGNSS